MEEMSMRFMQLGLETPLSHFLDGQVSGQQAMERCKDFFTRKKGNIRIEDCLVSLDYLAEECFLCPDLQLIVLDDPEHTTLPLEAMERYEDYPQPESREKVYATLQTLAQILNVPVITTAWLHRDLERRKNKRPKLSDLRKVNVPEELVDQVIFLYQEGYYNLEGDDGVECIVAKTCYGQPGTVKMDRDWQTGRFWERTD